MSNWLTALPIRDFGFELSTDAICLRYGWSIANVTTTCPCGGRFSVQHCVNSIKGGFISIIHNDLRDLTATLLSKVCKDVEIEPKLIPLTGEEIGSRTASTTNKLTPDHADFGKDDNN